MPIIYNKRARVNGNNQIQSLFVIDSDCIAGEMIGTAVAIAVLATGVGRQLKIHTINNKKTCLISVTSLFLFMIPGIEPLFWS